MFNNSTFLVHEHKTICAMKSMPVCKYVVTMLWLINTDYFHSAFFIKERYCCNQLDNVSSVSSAGPFQSPLARAGACHMTTTRKVTPNCQERVRSGKLKASVKKKHTKNRKKEKFI